MKFSNPLSADPRTSVFSTLVSQATVNGSTLGPYDVSSWDAIVVKLNSAVGAGGTNACTISWTDAAGNNLASRVLVSGSNTGQVSARVRNVGPFVTFSFTSTNNGGISVYTTNRQSQSDGPITPSCGGLVWYFGTFALASLAVATPLLFGTGGAQNFDGYCGPASLFVKTDSVNASGTAILQDVITGLDLAGAASTAPIGSAGRVVDTVPIMVPPRPCQLRVQNLGGGPVNLTAAITCAVG